MEQEENLLECAEKTEYVPWACVHCTSTGSSHLRAGIVCQDKTATRYDHGVYAYALADGAGSARLSHFGAEKVTEEICLLLCRHFEEWYAEENSTLVRQAILSHLLEQLNLLSQEHSCPVGELASTLLAVAVKGSRFLLLHIGDGVIGCTKGEGIRVLSAPKNGEFANTTFFVTSPGAIRNMTLAKGDDPEINGFVLMSDGSEASLYDKRNKLLAPILAGQIYRLGITSSAHMLPIVQRSLDQVIAKRTRDDCSLLLAARADRSYTDLDADELCAFFRLQELPVEETLAQVKGYCTILDCLSQERSIEQLAALFQDVSSENFISQWLQPLLDLGYIDWKTETTLFRLVGSVTNNNTDNF